MKTLLKLFGILLVLAVILVSCRKDQNSVITPDQNLDLKAQNGCWTIPGGQIHTSGGEVITTGYMENGYNYQAHIYNGEYDPGWHLVMKWSDSWLSNKDCDHDGLLDRPLDEDGNQYYFGSGAWCTNHWTTTYINDEGEECIYDEFIKIIAVPVDAILVDGYWYNADGVEIGENIWNQFAIIQYVVNDPCEGVEGAQYISPDHPGLGGW